MIYIKAFGFGLLFAIVAAALSLLVYILGEALYWRLIVLPRFQSDDTLSFGGGMVISINTAPLLATAAVGFAFGVWRVLRHRLRAH